MAQGDYVSQAEALAKSITCTQSSTNKISVITDGNPDPTLFDHVIPLEKDISGNSTWKIHNRVQFYELSPYDETVILDADMLFLSDVSHWWTHMSTYELLLTNHVVNFRGGTVTQSPYRRTFTGNKLPNVYSAFAYFKKTVFVKDFFQLVENIIVNWSEWTDRYAFAIERRNDVKGKIIVFSGALDEQTAADTFKNNINQGAFTGILMEYLTRTRENNKFKSISNIRDLLKEINCKLQIQGYNQKSQVSLSNKDLFDDNFELQI